MKDYVWGANIIFVSNARGTKILRLAPKKKKIEIKKKTCVNQHANLRIL